MRKYLFAAAIATIIAAPAFANDVGVHVGPVGAGVTTGEHHDRTDVKPGDRTTVIKKHDDMGNRSKTVIHHDDDQTKGEMLRALRGIFVLRPT